jgi:hypothetical protein
MNALLGILAYFVAFSNHHENLYDLFIQQASLEGQTLEQLCQGKNVIY